MTNCIGKLGKGDLPAGINMDRRSISGVKGGKRMTYKGKQGVGQSPAYLVLRYAGARDHLQGKRGQNATLQR